MQVLRTDETEQRLAAAVSRLDDVLSGLRDRIRMGERITSMEGTLLLRGNPPVGTCTICVGKRQIGWQSHFRLLVT